MGGVFLHSNLNVSIAIPQRFSFVIPWLDHGIQVLNVVPALLRIQENELSSLRRQGSIGAPVTRWIPAFAGMTPWLGSATDCVRVKGLDPVVKPRDDAECVSLSYDHNRYNREEDISAPNTKVPHP